MSKIYAHLRSGHGSSRPCRIFPPFARALNSAGNSMRNGRKWGTYPFTPFSDAELEPATSDDLTEGFSQESVTFPSATRYEEHPTAPIKGRRLLRLLRHAAAILFLISHIVAAASVVSIVIVLYKWSSYESTMGDEKAAILRKTDVGPTDSDTKYAAIIDTKLYNARKTYGLIASFNAVTIAGYGAMMFLLLRASGP